MAVDLDQAGDDGGAIQVDGIFGDIFGQNGTELAVHHFKGTGVELEITGENSRVFVEHRVLLLSFKKSQGRVGPGIRVIMIALYRNAP